LAAALSSAEAEGEGRALLFARRPDLYQKVGFEILDEVIRGEVMGADGDESWWEVKWEEYQSAYEAWAAGDPRRLLRDSLRWRYWQWSMKVPYRREGSYVVWEAGRLRELLPPYVGLPVGAPREWMGLAGLTDRLGVRLGSREHEMWLMGYGFPFVPEMFLTDQF
jgi:hypothetical protein